MPGMILLGNSLQKHLENHRNSGWSNLPREKKKSKQIDFQTERYLVRNRVEKKQETDKQTNLLLFKSYVS